MLRRFERRVYIPLPAEQNVRATMVKINVGDTANELADQVRRNSHSVSFIADSCWSHFELLAVLGLGGGRRGDTWLLRGGHADPSERCDDGTHSAAADRDAF